MGLTLEQATEMAAAGGVWLDTHGPVDGWWDRVDLSRLDISDSVNCVLGQVFADRTPDNEGYEWACRNMPGLRSQSVYELGFSYPYDLSDPEDFTYGTLALTEAWRQYINARRIAAQEPWITRRMAYDLAVSLGQMGPGDTPLIEARTLAEESLAA